MDRYAEQLNLLAIFDYVVGGLAALFSFFPLLYSVSAGSYFYAAEHPTPNSSSQVSQWGPAF